LWASVQAVGVVDLGRESVAVPVYQEQLAIALAEDVTRNLELALTRSVTGERRRPEIRECPPDRRGHRQRAQGGAQRHTSRPALAIPQPLRRCRRALPGSP